MANYFFGFLYHSRYLSAMGIEDKDHILIMGGYGSRSGKQEESPQNYYDPLSVEYPG